MTVITCTPQQRAAVHSSPDVAAAVQTQRRLAPSAAAADSKAPRTQRGSWPRQRRRQLPEKGCGAISRNCRVARHGATRPACKGA